jgi:hypothetical protein
LPVSFNVLAAFPALGRDDASRRRVEISGAVALGYVAGALDERVELDTGLFERRQFSGGGH